MKVDLVGNGCTWTRERSTSFIINDEILFDAPSGSFKTLFLDYDLSKIKYILITHFHSDHFLELHIILECIFKKYPNNKLTLIAPKGCYEKLCSLFRVLEVAYLCEVAKERITFIDCENGKKVKLGYYNIQIYKMNHNDLDAYGFVIQENQLKVGFTGDTSMCNNVLKILKKTSACFIDTAGVEINSKHLSVGEVISLEKEFSSCKLYKIHLSDMARAELEFQGKTYPKQSQTIYID